MIEIIILLKLSRENGSVAKEKGYNKGKYIFLTILCWLTGEFIGAIIGGLLFQGIIIYLFALVGAIIGAVIIDRYIKNLKDKNVNNEFDKEINNSNDEKLKID